ncbi:ribonuclease III [Candidatus Saccharibacteria bacterium]|nr:ribonuclease III [Candidatus Saccharibacteria bacterium]
MNKEQRDAYVIFAKQQLGIEFKNIDLLITALTHRSYVNEHRDKTIEHNERLEFLGDAVLELVSSDFLYRNYHQPEGIMTSWRAALVNTDANAAAGEELGYGPLVRLSNGEKRGSSRAHRVIMADCYEAVIGAIYLDQGYAVAEQFILKHTISKIDEILETESWRDSKSYLQELAQRLDNATPTYTVLREEGPDHDKTFTVGVLVNGHIKATGSGHSKQDAQVKAASEAIRQYKRASQQPSKDLRKTQK